MELNKKTLKNLFPHLTKELESKEHKVSIDSVRSDPKVGEKAATDKFSDYQPDVIDFIRRCDTEEQAEEIIQYMEERGEIATQYAQKLTTQLHQKGVRSFGSKKEDNYYFKQGRQ